MLEKALESSPLDCKEIKPLSSVQFSSLSHVRLFATPCTAARQASLSITNSRSLLKLMPIESVMPSNHLILCCPLLLLPSVFPSIRVFSNESALHIRWPKSWSFQLKCLSTAVYNHGPNSLPFLYSFAFGSNWVSPVPLFLFPIHSDFNNLETHFSIMFNTDMFKILSLFSIPTG